MKRILAPLAFIAGASLVQAQLPSCTTAITDAASLITQAKGATATDANAKAQQLQTIHQALANVNLIAACGTEATIVKNVEAKRTDVQPGAPAGASGTTTAVASASKPNFLGLALENGATTQTTSGTSSTLSINPWKFVDSIAHDEKKTIDPNDAGSKLLRKLSLSLTLNTGSSTNSKQTSTTMSATTPPATTSTATSGTTTTTTTTTPITLITELKEVSDFTLHFDILNNRDPMSPGAARKIREKVKVPAAFFQSAGIIGAFRASEVAAEEQKLLTFTGDVNSEVTKFVNGEVPHITANPAAAGALKTFQTAASEVIRNNSALYSGLLHSPTLSFEYSLDRQPMVQAMASTTASTTGATTASTPASTAALMNPPDLHTARLIHAWGYYTVNASASFFGQKTAAMPDVWRDLQFGAKVDIPFSGIANVVDKGTLTLSGLFVDLHQMPLGINLMVNGVSVTQPGRIGLFQAKYTVPLGSGSGVQLPISITYSNRTDLIRETSIQGNIGLTFDMSKLIAAKQAPAQ